MNNTSFAATPGDAETVQQQPARMRLTLRTQGFVLLGVAIVLVLLYGVFIASQREKLVNHFVTIQSQQKLEEQLVHIGTALFWIDHEIDEALVLPDPSRGIPAILRNFEAQFIKSGKVLETYPQLVPQLTQIYGSIKRLRDGDVRANLVNLGLEVHDTAARLNGVLEKVAKRQGELSDNYLEITNTVTFTSAVISILALTGFGFYMIHFINRLTSAITALCVHAREIQTGLYSTPLTVDRGDEIGELIAAMNHMGGTLQQREKDLAISRQRYFHEEKMTAVKSLAAGIAHEIGNPLETISLVAQDMVNAREKYCGGKGGYCKPELILEQIQRISRITREMSNFTAPSMPEPQLQDINGLIRGACNFVRYDRRYRKTDLVLELDHGIHAVNLVADQFVQIMLNVLINAADACEANKDRPSRVIVSSQQVDAGVLVRVRDNGSGMNQETLSHAFDAFFTTKTADHGTGLGLIVCKSIVEACGGTIRLTSEEKIGTSVDIFLPAE